MSKPYKVHVTVCGTPAGAYEFDTLEEAQADMKERKKFEVLGCHYRLETPESEAEAAVEKWDVDEALFRGMGTDARTTLRNVFIAGYLAAKERP